MARGTNQKLKLYYLVQIMLAKTDEEHSLTMPQIIQELGKYDITAERKSIYLDFDDMISWGSKSSRSRGEERPIIMWLPESLSWQKSSC